MKAATALRQRHVIELQDYPAACAWAADGKACFIAGSEGALLRIASQGAAWGVQPLGEHTGGIAALAVQPGGAQLATAGQDGSLRLWSTATLDAAPGPALRVLRAAGGFPAALAYAVNGRHLAAAAGRAVTLWDGAGEPLPMQPAQADTAVAALAWRPAPANARRPASELAAVGQGELNVHAIEPQLVTTRESWARGSLLAAWSPDGRVLASGLQEGAVYFRTIATSRQSRMSGYAGKVTQLSWSASAKHLATACAGNCDIVVWDFSGRGPEGTHPHELKGHDERIVALGFQPKGKLLASAGRDWRISLWMPGTSPLAVTVQLMQGELAALAWSPDGRMLLAAEAGGRITLFEVT